MEGTPNKLDLVKTLAHPDRLKVVGVLVRQPATLKEICAALSLNTRQAYNHISFLKYVGIVEEEAGLFRLGRAAPIRLEDFEADTIEIDHMGLGAARFSLLKAYFKKDGTLRRIPNSRTQPEKFRLLLEYLQAAFEIGTFYSEKQVNAILVRFHPDTAGLRRDLVDAGLLARERDGSRYWRPDPQVEQ
jgi:hypothetical protein